MISKFSSEIKRLMTSYETLVFFFFTTKVSCCRVVDSESFTRETKDFTTTSTEFILSSLMIQDLFCISFVEAKPVCDYLYATCITDI